MVIKNRIVIILILILSPFLWKGAGSEVFAQNWISMGNVTSGGGPINARCFYVDSTQDLIYMGGAFNGINGEHIQGIATWNGTQWDSLGVGIDSTQQYPNNVLCITKFQNKIYVGGAYEWAGSIHANGIATWDGNKWDSLSVKPFGGSIYQGAFDVFYEYNNELYAGGSFCKVDTITANSLAKWDGSKWMGVGSFPNSHPDPCNTTNNIADIIEYKGELYVGGIFGNLNSNMQSIARYDGVSWKNVGRGITGGFAAVNTMAVYKNELYVGGLFYTADGNVGNSIQKWDGNQWSDVGGGMGGNAYPQVWDLFEYHNDLYAVGVFDIAGGIPASKIAKWDGNQWCGLGGVFNSSIVKGCVYHDQIIVSCGAYYDTMRVNCLAKWVGGNYIDTCGFIPQGINKQTKNKNFFSIYPNPNTGIFTIQNTGDNIHGAICVTNILGETIYEAKTTSNKTQIDLSSQPKGMYFIKVDREVKKLIIE